MSRNSDAMVAFLLGAVTGGVIALLLAPEKGEVTRHKIRKGANDLYGKGRSLVKDTGEDLTERAGQLAEKARDKAQDVAEGARHHVSAVKEAFAEGREAYRRELEKS
jgi:gas vesicle protein